MNAIARALGFDSLWSGSPPSSRQALIALFVELGVGLAISLFVLSAFVFASSRVAWAGPFVTAEGKPTPFAAMLVFTAMLVVAQGAAALLVAQRPAPLRIVGILIGLVFAGLCALFLGALAFEFATNIASGRPLGGGDQYDQIGVIASIVPAVAVLTLNARAVYFAIREMPAPAG